MDKDNIMSFSNVLPEDFNGTFTFTNWSDEDFVATWGGKQYQFPAQSMSPMVILNESPIQVQQIRKKFAKDLAEREFFKGAKYEKLRLREGTRDELGMINPRGQGMSHAGQYTLDDLAPFIQKCLEPLPIKRAEVKEAPKLDMEQILTRNDKDELNTEAIDKNVSLKEKAKRK